MYGIIIEVSVDPNREKEARNMVANMIVPRARTHQGIMAGYCLRALDGDILKSVQLYDTEATLLQSQSRFNLRGHLLVRRSPCYRWPDMRSLLNCKTAVNIFTAVRQ